MRILLVEDERRLSGYIAKGLQNSGYAVDAVYDGEAALYEYGVRRCCLTEQRSTTRTHSSMVEQSKFRQISTSRIELH